MNILLVEDNPGDIILAKEALKISSETIGSYHLEVAKDGEEAIKFLHRQGRFKKKVRPDLIFLDLNLPRKNGFEVLREIKSSESLRKIPVVVFSTSSSEFDINNSYQFQANCYVTKPVDFDDFIQVMGSVLNFWKDTLLPTQAIA
ncbi:MAG: response regulator [Bacteroidota bacterium]